MVGLGGVRYGLEPPSGGENLEGYGPVGYGGVRQSEVGSG